MKAGSRHWRRTWSLACAFLSSCAVILGTACSHPGENFLLANPPPDITEYDPDYSPDGSSLVFTYQSPTIVGPPELWKFTFADSALEKIGIGEAPTWSHDGRSIAFVAASQLFRYDTGTRATTNLWNFSDPFSPSRPTWSPGDRWIAVDRYFSYADTLGGLWAHATSGDSTVRLLSAAVAYPCWSPDSSRIAFTLLYPSLNIGVLRLATGSIDTLTHAGDNRDPAWSKDGQCIAWSGQSQNGGRAHIWIMRADGSAKQDLHVEGFGPTWSPDGSTIVYSGYDLARNAYFLRRMRRDGTNSIRLLGFWNGG